MRQAAIAHYVQKSKAWASASDADPRHNDWVMVSFLMFVRVVMLSVFLPREAVQADQRQASRGPNRFSRWVNAAWAWRRKAFLQLNDKSNLRFCFVATIVLASGVAWANTGAPFVPGTPLCLAPSASQTLDHPHLLRFPAISGDTIVFSYGGELWRTQGLNGDAVELTTAPGLQARPKISPDGKWVAFTGTYDGPRNIYVMPLEGGEPRRLTYDTDDDYCLGWTPDGRIAYSTYANSATWAQRNLFYVKPTGGLSQKTALREVTELSFFPGGKQIAYTRHRSYDFNWRRYRGGTQGKISLYDFSKNAYSELPSKREQSYFPMVVGSKIFYISDRGTGTLNLFAYDTVDHSDRRLTSYADGDIRYPNTDGRSIVWERGGSLYRYTIATGAVDAVEPRIRSDFLATRPRLHALGGAISEFDIAPSGKLLTCIARGKLFFLPTEDGDTRLVTTPESGRVRGVQFAPNGKSVCFLDDATGETELYLVPAIGGLPTQITNDKRTYTGLTWFPDSNRILASAVDQSVWIVDVAKKSSVRLLEPGYDVSTLDVSPDGKFIAIVYRQGTGLPRLGLIDTESKRLFPVTDGSFMDSKAVFDRTGKYLYLVSARNISPEFGTYELTTHSSNAQGVYVISLSNALPDPTMPPADNKNELKEGETHIDLEGLADRIRPLPIPSGSFGTVFGIKNGLLFQQGETFMKWSVGAKSTTPVLSGGVGALAIAFDSEKLAYGADGNIGVISYAQSSRKGDGQVDLGNIQAVIDPRTEWKQIVYEAWRYERDHYFDAKMNGLNWKAIGDRYEGMVRWAVHRSDVNYILGLMLGELATSHVYVENPGDLGASPPAQPVGHLGADYTIDRGLVRISRIVRGEPYSDKAAPLFGPGIDVKEGDYLLEIDGKPVNGDIVPDSLLIGKVGSFVTLTLSADGSPAHSRLVRVRPVGSEQGLRYIDFVESCRRHVETRSGGRIGYVQVPDTGVGGQGKFMAAFYANLDKEAFIVDERWNGGGSDPAPMIELLSRRDIEHSYARNSPSTQARAAITGPKALIINEVAGSGGDNFAFRFKSMGLGPLIGKRTWGGLCGISGACDLVDGGSVSTADEAIFDPETNEIIAENEGIDPDIEVDLRPDLVATGHDPQLDRAIDYLLEKLNATHPRKAWDAAPHRGGKAEVGH